MLVPSHQVVGGPYMVYITLSSLDHVVVFKQWWGQQQLSMYPIYMHQIKPFRAT